LAIILLNKGERLISLVESAARAPSDPAFTRFRLLLK
jgi:hypothetical protein